MTSSSSKERSQIEEELKKIDEFETDVYKRKKVVLSDGKEAWVYVKN